MLKSICKMLMDILSRLFGSIISSKTEVSHANRSQQMDGPLTLFGSSTAPYLELDIDSQTILGEYVTVGGKTYRVPHFALLTSNAAPIIINNAKGAKTFYAFAPTTSPLAVLLPNTSRISALFYNAGTNDIYLGGNAGVSPSNGMKLVAGAALIDGNSNDGWYAVTSSGTGDLRIIEVHNP